MKPAAFFSGIVDPSLRWLGLLTGIPSDERAQGLVMTIAGQEGSWKHRRQIGGPARSYWQGELTGGMILAVHHPASMKAATSVLQVLEIGEPNLDHWVMPGDRTIYEAMAWNDTLACCLARLLLWTDPAPLPALGQPEAAWQYYLKTWRPGAPHRETWDAYYATSLELVRRPL